MRNFAIFIQLHNSAIFAATKWLLFRKREIFVQNNIDLRMVLLDSNI